jgi:hypothetical protein
MICGFYPQIKEFSNQKINERAPNLLLAGFSEV